MVVAPQKRVAGKAPAGQVALAGWRCILEFINLQLQLSMDKQFLLSPKLAMIDVPKMKSGNVKVVPNITPSEIFR